MHQSGKNQRAIRAGEFVMSKVRLAGLTGAAALASLAGGCAVYSTPSGDVIGPAPVVVAPPAVVVRPYYDGYYGRPRYNRPYYGPRYYGRPYYRY
jgi:hypothetical protein